MTTRYLKPILWTDFCLARVPCRPIMSWLLGSGSISSLNETLKKGPMFMKYVYVITSTENKEPTFELLKVKRDAMI